VSLIRMDSGLDTGPIVAIEPIALDGSERADALEERLATIAAGLLARSVDTWLDGSLTADPQPSDGASLTRPLRRADGRLDPARPAVDLERRVRAFAPWPGTFVEVGGQRLAVLDATVAPAIEGDEPGRIVAAGDDLALATVEGRLVLREVQPAGGGRMAGAAFRRGRRDIVGASVDPGVGASPDVPPTVTDGSPDRASRPAPE
jgi:methionyl-tRNA formyltransferase